MFAIRRVMVGGGMEMRMHDVDIIDDVGVHTHP